MTTRTISTFRIGIATLCAWIALPLVATAQCDKVAEQCAIELTDFLSDGQYYRAQVIEGETATLKVSFLEGFVYRVVACTDANGAKVKYSLHDGSNAQIFSNDHVEDGTGWDFQVNSTDEFTLKATLGKSAGCIVFSIGYDDTLFMDEDDMAAEDDPFFEDGLSDEDYGLDEKEEDAKQ
jgi:hypothetical protein